MTTFLLWVLAIQAMAIMGWAMIRRERMIQFPFLAAAVFLGWVFPELLGLTNHGFLPGGALEKTIFMSILCLGAAWLGYVSNRRPARMFSDWTFDRPRLVLASAIMSILGAFFFYQVSLLAPDVTAETGGAWTGKITIYVFFSKLLAFGMVIALICYLRKPDWLALGVFLLGLAVYSDRILRGRRSAMVELGTMVLLALWFNRRMIPPRWSILAVVVVGALVVNSIGEYRQVMVGEDRFSWSGAGISELMEIDYWGNLKAIAQGERGANMENTVWTIEAVDRSFRFDFGLAHWNGFVRSYVPGQLVGHDLKEALQLNLGNPAFIVFGHTGRFGSTSTGMADSFQSFWYLGAVKFFLIGLIMSRWYRAAMLGSITAQIVVIATLSYSLVAITHSTHWFFTIFLQLAAFVIPALLFARVSRRTVGAMHPLSPNQMLGK